MKNYKKAKLLMCISIMSYSNMGIAAEIDKHEDNIIKGNSTYKIYGKHEKNIWATDLASFLSTYSSNDSKDPSSIVLSSNGLDNLSAEQLKNVKDSYEMGYTIAHLHPQPGTIEKTFAALETKIPCMFKDNSHNIEMHSFQKTKTGWKQETFPLSKFSSDAKPFTKSSYVTWLTHLENSPNNSFGLSRNFTATAGSTGTESSNLLNMADQIEDIYHYNISPGSYQVTTLTVPASVKDTNNNIFYYYWVGQQFVLNPQGGKLTQYTFNLIPRLAAWVDLIICSPDTTKDSKSVTSTISQTLGQKVGFFGETSIRDVSSNVTVSNSKTYQIPEVTIINDSPMRTSPLTTSGLRWNFELLDGSPVATSAFQPFIQALWRGKKAELVNYGPQGFDIDMEFGVSPSNVFPNDTHRITVGFPPDPRA